MTEADKVIPPGGVGKVTASLKTEHLKGTIVKSVTVTATNDPTVAAVSLQLKAEVLVPLEIQPGEYASIIGKLGALKPAELTLTSASGKPFSVLSLQSDHKELNLEVRAATAGTGKARSSAGNVATGASSYVLVIAPRPDIPIGRFAANIVMATDVKGMEKVDLHVNVVVQGEVQVMPERLYMRARPPTATGVTGPGIAPNYSAPLQQRVTLRKPEGSEFKVKGAECVDKDFDIKLHTMTEGREYQLEVKYIGKTGRGPVTTEVTVRTTEPHQPTITVPLSGVF